MIILAAAVVYLGFSLRAPCGSARVDPTPQPSDLLRRQSSFKALEHWAITTVSVATGRVALGRKHLIQSGQDLDSRLTVDAA